MRIETVEIKKLGINGEGIGYIDRKIIFIKGALIGEIVEVNITNTTRKYYEGEIRKIKSISKDRVTPSANQAKEGSEYTLLHMKYSSQLRFKKEAIRESIRKYTSYNLDNTVFKDVIACKPLEGFISTVNLPVVQYKNRLSFGIYQRESKQLTILTNSFRHDPRINTCLQQLEIIINQHGCKTYNDKTRLGLRFIKVKLVKDSLQIVFITGKDGLPKGVSDAIRDIENVQGLFVSVNTSRYQEFEEVGYTKVFGKTLLEWYHQDKKYMVSIKSRLADNITMYEKRNNEILKMLEDSQNVISLHCGIGVLELQMEQTVIAIDEKQYHIEDAKVNQKWAKKDNITFIRGDIDDKVVTYAKKKIYDTFIIQNGRFGLSEEIKDSIRLSKAKHVIYVCESHPTLAKDLADLEKYYHLEKIVALDTFAYMPHVSVIVKLTRK